METENKRCTKPCNECPFRVKSTPGFLGGFSTESTLESALSEQDFICHKTRGRFVQRQCAGRILFAANNFKSFRNPILNSIMKFLTNKHPNRKKDILDMQSFKQHHN